HDFLHDSTTSASSASTASRTGFLCTWSRWAAAVSAGRASWPPHHSWRQHSQALVQAAGQIVSVAWAL
ncbi:hypothetical protein HaLaN_10004, partial [Haematococcus lacustris]